MNLRSVKQRKKILELRIFNLTWKIRLLVFDGRLTIQNLKILNRISGSMNLLKII